jgi:hypothetical protein
VDGEREGGGGGLTHVENDSRARNIKKERMRNASRFFSACLAPPLTTYAVYSSLIFVISSLSAVFPDKQTSTHAHKHKQSEHKQSERKRSDRSNLAAATFDGRRHLPM